MIKDTQTPLEDDKNIWDKVLASPEGIDALAELMKEAKKEVSEGKIEDI